MQYWDIEERGGIVVVGYKNPPTNYLIAPAMGELDELIASWREPEVKVVVLTGAVPDRYITHYSVEELVEMGNDPDQLRRSAHSLIYGYHTLLRSLAYLDKPIVVAMTGDTMGAGLELSLNCDIRIAQRGDFRIGFPEVALGILTGTGSQLLARIIGQGRAMDFMLRSRTVSPEGALELGIVTELAEDARARAIEIAEGLLRQSAVSVVAAKRSIVRGANLPIEEGLRIEAEQWLNTIVTEQAMTLMRDYVSQPFEKRREWVRSHGIPPVAGNAIGS
ncbi:MAG: enoyl-CoA hydratase/carnithine racemase [Gammaproteobacteria bacterium]|jgi:enoyl-CoA hydratase/carnithine racemase